MTESVSPWVVVDLTPPLCGDIHVEGLLPHSNTLTTTSLKLHLKRFHDPESSLTSLHLRVLTSANTDTSYVNLAPDTQLVNIDIHTGFVDGHKYRVSVQVGVTLNIQTIVAQLGVP